MKITTCSQKIPASFLQSTFLMSVNSVNSIIVLSRIRTCARDKCSLNTLFFFYTCEKTTVHTVHMFTSLFKHLKTNFFVNSTCCHVATLILFCIVNNTFYISKMEPDLIILVENSGYRKNFIAEKLKIVPNHFYQCLKGNRHLSVKKQTALRNFLTI